MNITNTVGIHTYYADRILDIMREIKSTPIVWQDVWDEKVEVGVCWECAIHLTYCCAHGFSYQQARSFKYGRVPVTRGPPT